MPQGVCQSDIRHGGDDFSPHKDASYRLVCCRLASYLCQEWRFRQNTASHPRVRLLPYRLGERGRGAEGKVLVAVAVELLSPKGFGRCRLQIIPNAETETLKAFIRKHIKPGSTILLTDGLTSNSKFEI